MKKLVSLARSAGTAAAIGLVTAQAHATDLLGNSASSSFADIKDTQTGMIPLVFGIAGVSVAVGLGMRWLFKSAR